MENTSLSKALEALADFGVTTSIRANITSVHMDNGRMLSVTNKEALIAAAEQLLLATKHLSCEDTILRDIGSHRADALAEFDHQVWRTAHEAKVHGRLAGYLERAGLLYSEAFSGSRQYRLTPTGLAAVNRHIVSRPSNG